MGGENIKRKNKRIAFFIFTTMPLVLCNTVYAVTTSEIQAAVDSQGKDAVAGNIFIWFLCAIAFLKISQKIDSFMSGLGVNVGHTGGSMMAEAMIVARSLGVGGKGLLNKGFGGGGSSPGGGSGEKGGLLSGGLAGVVGRSFNNSAMNAATGKDAGLFGKKAFESSLKSGGDLAKDVIGKVAKGDISKTGSITGETADKALGAYLGYDGGAAMLDSDTSGSSSIPTDIGGIDENADSVTPVEASSVPGIGTPPEAGTVTDVSGASVPSTPESVKDGAAAATATEEIPMESTSDTMPSGDMPDIGYLPEIQSDMNTDMGEQSEISSADSEQSDMVTADENAGLQPEPKIPMNPDATDISASETPMPTAASDGMPELPEIVPDYDSGEDSGHPVTIVPDAHSGISASASEPDSVSDSPQSVSSGGIVQSDINTGTAQAVSGSDTSPVNVSQPVIPQSPSGSHTAQSDSVPVSGATPVQSSSTPVSGATPVQSDSVPISGATPVQSDSVPISGVTPIQSSSVPVSGTTPVQSDSVPISGTMPVQSGSAPVSGTMPVQSGSAPVSEATPVQSSSVPVSGAMPMQSSSASVSEATPVQSSSVPVSGATPIQSSSTPVSGATPIQGGSVPVAVSQSAPGGSSSGNQTQVNTVSNTANNTATTNADVNASAAVTQQEHINSPVTIPADSSATVPVSSGNESIGSMPQLTSGNGLGQNAANIPVFSNVEIGGGRIMGTETSDKFPNGAEFGMYNTAQYMKPEGDFTTVKTVDGAKWYKQYAAPKVERTPIVEENGKIKYEEKIVNKLPPVPRRKDKV